MAFDPDGTYVPATGAITAAPGQIIASATWNGINQDVADALTLLGQVSLAEPTIKTTAGPFTITTETLLVLKKVAPSTTGITLPAVASRAQQWLMVVDWASNAGDITFTPNGVETIQGAATWAMGSGSKIILVPSTDLAGWIVLLG